MSVKRLISVANYFNLISEEHPVKIITVYVYYIVSLLILFANFFVASYVIKGSKGKKSRSTKTKEN